MLAWKLDGPIEFWNAGAERLYGFSPGEAIGQSSHAILQTKFPLSLPQMCAQLRDTGQWSGELRHICKDGREVIVDSRMELLDDTVLEVNRDITDRKQMAIAIIVGVASLLATQFCGPASRKVGDPSCHAIGTGCLGLFKGSQPARIRS